ncbi:MAG: 16S rRNA (guanine(527)-N(7))-methyltransferase RsmG [Flavobacteriales bacterium]|nr:16S rRNA (guanine(527)-N(7))-methyltransferase RsmG [Flavobacteriales bacterium]
MNPDIIFNYFPELKVSAKNKIENLYTIYQSHNKKINLISRKDFNFFYQRHVLHSLSICKKFIFKKDFDIMDLGTGGGFPGIPLAIFFPDTNFYLVDSIKKKTISLLQIVSDLDLKNVKIINNRSENLDLKFDFIISRAVASLSKLDEWTKNKFKNKNNCGLICLKGGDLNEELIPFKNRVKIHNISDFYKEDFFLSKKIIFLPVEN